MSRFLKQATALGLAAALCLTTGCYTQRFDVGTGGGGGETREFTQWYALWGLVPITQIEGQVEDFTADSQNYTVTTQFTPLDVLIGIFTNIVTIGPKTVTVAK